MLLSDTHGYLDEVVLRYAKEADEIWHAGDIGKIAVADKLSKLKPLRAVYGNADDHVVRMTHPLEQEFIVEGLKVWMIHIGGYPGHYPTTIRQTLLQKKPNLFICGHSHILKVIRDPSLNLIHMNPGACGIYGFHTVRTIIRFTIHQGKIVETDVIELGPKGNLTKSVG